VKVIKSDFSPESLAVAFKDQDAIVSTVGPTGKRAQTKLIDAAVAAGIKRFIPSDFAYKSYDMSELERRVPALYQRLAAIGNQMVLNYVQEKAARNPGFTWTAMGGGLFFDWVSLTLIPFIMLK
jgi:hypothetical protein